MYTLKDIETWYSVCLSNPEYKKEIAVKYAINEGSLNSFEFDVYGFAFIDNEYIYVCKNINNLGSVLLNSEDLY